MLFRFVSTMDAGLHFRRLAYWIWGKSTANNLKKRKHLNGLICPSYNPIRFAKRSVGSPSAEIQLALCVTTRL